jgi:sugar phosphate isomerase/epimerase
MQSRNLLSLAYLTVNGAQPVEHLEAAQAGGFDAAGLRIVPPSHLAIDYGVIGNPERIREIKRTCDRTGVGVLDIEVVTLNAETDVARLLPALETSAEIGAQFIQAVSEDPDERRAADRFAALCDAAARFGLRVSLEFMRFRNLRTIEAAAALVEAAGRPNGGVLVDALHLARSGGTPAAVAAVPPGRIAYMQLCDGPAQSPPLERLAHESRNERRLPGEGEFLLEELFDALPDEIPISVEVPRAVDAGRSMTERAVLAGDATRAWMTRYRARRS